MNSKETTPAIPLPLQRFVNESVMQLKQDHRILGLAAGGSYLLNEMDEFSDLDLVIYIEPQHYLEVLNSAKTIAGTLGPLVECFTGEHVGEPRLLICLFDPPLLHVDLKFVSLDDIHEKVENPIVLWERESQLTALINVSPADFPQPDVEWIEARFWIWVHYTATKIGRGELFEAIDSIGFIRIRVLGPLILTKHAARPQGLRKVEFVASAEELMALKQTIPTYDAGECVQALRCSVDLYRRLRKSSGNIQAENLATEYLDQIEANLN